MDDYQRYIHQSKYARWRDDLGRRETWEETVTRLVDYYHDRVCELTGEVESFGYLADAILNMDVMPSMRAMMTAGPALDRCNVGAYNCAYLPVDSPRSFDEAMYILLCGTGVGFSVEEKYVSQLPRISEEFADSDTTIVVGDSKEGWAKAFRELVTLLIAGQIPRWDTSQVRPAGARLVTFGGRASGPEPLVRLFEFTVRLLQSARGRRLTPLECHDLMCMIADVVVVGGVRRAAIISLSDLGNEPMSKAKSGRWYEDAVYRQLSNNSAVYEQKPTVGEFLKEWREIHDSGQGERGIFNRDASRRVVEAIGRRDPNHEFGTNPCSEIILRPYQFCNLSAAVVRAGDSLSDLKRKVRLATILGTIQSTFTEFRYLRKIWKRNCDEERLLGVSLIGNADNREFYFCSDDDLKELKSVAIETNKEWAERLGIPVSAAITCVKPAGNSGEQVDAASGQHKRWSHYYLRSVRNDVRDPLSQFLIDQGVPYEIDQRNPDAYVFYFPRKSPKGALTRGDTSVIDELEYWKKLQKHWCEHKPSATIYVPDDQWLAVADWVYKNFDILSGVAFLPFNPTEYPQAPYQTLTEEEYNEWLEKMPKEIDWEKLRDYEKDDMTTGSFELACTGGVCEL